MDYQFKEPELAIAVKKQALIDYWTKQGIGNSIRPDTWEKSYIDEQYDILARTHQLEPAAPVITTKQVTFSGMAVCGKRGRKAPANQTRLELSLE